MLLPEKFEKYVRNWAMKRISRFQYYWPLKGGWELWVQVDFMAYVFEHNNIDDILREQPIFTNPKQRVDLLLNGSGNAAQAIPVEIKAQSLANHHKFFAEVIKDKLKLESQRTSTYNNCQCIQMVLLFNPEDYRRVRDITNANNERIFNTIIVTTDVAILVSVLDKNGNWLPAHRSATETEEMS